MDHNNILGTVLAGGKSQRFGEDKSQVKLAGKLLIDHMLAEIIDEFKELLIVSNNKINFYNSEKISIIEDFEKIRPAITRLLQTQMKNDDLSLRYGRSKSNSKNDIVINPSV